MMKRFVSILVVLIILCTLLVACDTNDGQIRCEEPWILISYSGPESCIHQKIFYNVETELTYINDYRWKHENGIYTVTSQTLTILDKQGTIISSTVSGEPAYEK